MEALLTKPTLTLLRGRATYQAVGMYLHVLCDSAKFVCTNSLTRELTYCDHPRQLFCDYVVKGWWLLGETNAYLCFGVFLFIALLLTGLTYMHAGTIFGA